eukprot:TRINITY_DN8041_c0_g1_i1.p1 TRINITY_DN8041_c0_g1~~TRINITY_DN8041_c0_g1_i1.p1  ORF type:complete len:386 (-),score=68.18 TRINITY_DN8041_c0_g1_i1:142-1299(-)
MMGDNNVADLGSPKPGDAVEDTKSKKREYEELLGEVKRYCERHTREAAPFPPNTYPKPVPLAQIARLASACNDPETWGLVWYDFDELPHDLITCVYQMLASNVQMARITPELVHLQICSMVDATLDKDRRIAVGGLLQAIRGLAQDTDDNGFGGYMCKSPTFIPTLINYLLFTHWSEIREEIFGILAQLAELASTVFPEALETMRTFKVHTEWFVTVGLRIDPSKKSQAIPIWRPLPNEQPGDDGTYARKEMVNLVPTVVRGLVAFWNNSKGMREDLQRMGLKRKVEALLDSCRDPVAKEHLQLLNCVLLSSNPNSSSSNKSSSPIVKRTSTRSCANCQKEDDGSRTHKKCSSCKAVYYCGRDCQVADWRRGHKTECKKLTTRNK